MKKVKKITIAQKAKKAGIPAQIVYNRMHEGWSEKKALSVPVNNYTKKKPEKVAYKVEPSEVQRSGSRVKKPVVPLTVQKFEAPKSKMFIYLAIVLLVALVVVVAR
jgi:hypothetical protein